VLPVHLIGHHTHGIFEMEILGKPFPDGPTEHVLGLALGVLVLSLTAYGAFAALRDLVRWRRAARQHR
jgi:hypothetical protein